MKKWNLSGRSRRSFFTRYKSWLNGENYIFNPGTIEEQPSTSTGSVTLTGRPKVSFDDSSFKTKKRRVQDLVESRSLGELTVAAEVAVRLSGRRDAANLIKEVTTQSPERASKIKKARLQKQQLRILTQDEALAYYVDSKSTTNSYKLTRKWAMKTGHAGFPSIYSVQKAKNDCYPSSECISVTEIRAEITLQGILDITVKRLLKAQEEVIKTLLPNANFTLICKWGCDGSSGHSRYKQKFADTAHDDEFLFVFSFVPLKLCLENDDSTWAWKNPSPSSTMYCRPIKFIFSKESDILTQTETAAIQEQIQTLLATKYVIDNVEISVNHKLLLTMVDGKVCNALTGTRSTQTCYICKATPKNMNTENTEFTDTSEYYGFGLSTLHAWIRSFECLLHISYRINVKKWQIKDTADKAEVKKQKEIIQSRFRQELGLIVDMPKPGFGSTNDGNTARRFFKNPDRSANITGLDVTLIKHIGILLRALSSGYDINLEKFEKFCKDTRDLYLSLYSWYYMPVTLHKILFHSSKIIEFNILPIGQLSEEAQEARNKDCRRFRELNTRKRSRVTTNKDLMSMLLITSDPVINSLREKPRQNPSILPAEVLDLLVNPKVPTISLVQITDSDNDYEDESDYSEYFSESDEDLN